MIFTPAIARSITAGRKTQHRVVARADKHGIYNPPVTRAMTYPVEIRENVTPPYSRRRVIQVVPLAYIKITELERGGLLDMDLAGARGEGFRTQRDFFDYWLGRRMHRLAHEQLLDLDVWVVRFELVEEVRLLECGVVRTEHGYTTRPDHAMIGEPEAIDPDDIKHIHELRSQQHDALRGTELRRREAKRVAAGIRQLEAQGVLDDDHLAALRSVLNEARRANAHVNQEAA